MKIIFYLKYYSPQIRNVYRTLNPENSKLDMKNHSNQYSFVFMGLSKLENSNCQCNINKKFAGEENLMFSLNHIFSAGNSKFCLLNNNY